MTAMVQALLASATKAHEALYAKTDAAVVRYKALPEDEDREDFRTALRDFVRTYSFLGQVIPFQSSDLEELFYYGKVLITRLPKDEDPGGFDLGDAAVLTHIRTQLIGEHNLALAEGHDEQVPGMAGGGRGAQTAVGKVLLSQIIDLLNEKFGSELTEVDQLLFDQQVQAAAQDADLREVAASNTEENFGYVFDKRFVDILIDRQSANDDLLRMFFDKPEFKEALTAWARREVYKKITDDLGGAA
jgi:type I restriction enzyme R subunit